MQSSGEGQQISLDDLRNRRLFRASAQLIRALFARGLGRLAGVALSEPVTTDSARTMLGLLGVPAVAAVSGLFKWVADGDLVLVDGDHGFLRLNPSRAEVSRVRVSNKG